MTIDLKYGSRTLTLNIPQQAVIPEYTQPTQSITKEKFIRDLKKRLPVDSIHYDNVGIVVADKTRLCGYPLYLPWLLEVLRERGAEHDNLHFYIAYGTHPRQSEEESIQTYGQLYKDYHFIHHQCDDPHIFETLDTTTSGTPVTIRRDLLKSTLIITFGAISHHYFAGFGGGRKLLFPGLAQKEAIYHNHGLFLDRKARSLAYGCQPGKLDYNPIAEDLREIDSFFPPKISIHGIMNETGEVCDLLVGDSYASFISACKVHDSYYKYNQPEQFDLVIASSGGYPKDINFIQAHKSVHHAAAFVKDGGHLVILSECIDKIGSNYFMKFLEAGSFENAFRILEQHYEGNGGTALSMMLKTQRIKISMVTSLDDKTCQTLRVTKIDESDIQKIIDGENGRIAVLKNASILVK